MCSSNSVYLEIKSFAVRADVANSEVKVFADPWSEQMVLPATCTAALPCKMLVKLNHQRISTIFLLFVKLKLSQFIK